MRVQMHQERLFLLQSAEHPLQVEEAVLSCFIMLMLPTSQVARILQAVCPPLETITYWKPEDILKKL